jgi:hypothetical protein
MSALGGQTNSIDLLRGIPSLRQLSDVDLGRVAALLGERSVAPDEVLIQEDAVGDCSFLVLDGYARVISGGVPIARVGPGEFVGELALLTDAPRCATVQAETAMRLLVLDKATLASLIDPITEALLGTLARRVRREANVPAVAAGEVAGRWSVGVQVTVRSRYAGRWVEGFEIADLDLAAAKPRIQVRRHSDAAVLPVFFDADDVRLA